MQDALSKNVAMPNAPRTRAEAIADGYHMVAALAVIAAFLSVLLGAPVLVGAVISAFIGPGWWVVGGLSSNTNDPSQHKNFKGRFQDALSSWQQRLNIIGVAGTGLACFIAVVTSSIYLHGFAAAMSIVGAHFMPVGIGLIAISLSMSLRKLYRTYQIQKKHELVHALGHQASQDIKHEIIFSVLAIVGLVALFAATTLVLLSPASPIAIVTLGLVGGSALTGVGGFKVFRLYRHSTPLRPWVKTQWRKVFRKDHNATGLIEYAKPVCPSNPNKYSNESVKQAKAAIAKQSIYDPKELSDRLIANRNLDQAVDLRLPRPQGNPEVKAKDEDEDEREGDGGTGFTERL